MPYVHISQVPGQGLDHYRSVLAALGDTPPEGRLVGIVGECDGALHLVDVWESRAHADRFAAERLLPAIRAAGVTVGPEATFTVFDAAHVAVGETR